MVGKAVARRQSGIELQGETHAGCQHQRQKLQRENGAVDGVVGGHLLEQLGENTRQIRQEAHVEGRHKNRQEHHHAGGDEPHGGDDQLAPHMLMDGGGQGEHDVALVPQQILVEPLEHQDERHNEHADDGRHIGQDHQSCQDVQNDIAGVHQPGGEIEAQGHRQQNQVQRPHDAGRGTEFVLQEFRQHLNTSRNRASTLMPFSSRISSTEDWSTTWP